MRRFGVIVLVFASCVSFQTLKQGDSSTGGTTGSTTASTGGGTAGTSTGSATGSTTATSCVPSSELCNGIDDDCDTEIDEGFAGLGQACDGADSDLCAEGVIVCDGPSATRCNDDSDDTLEDLCSVGDDDCDGSPQPFALQVSNGAGDERAYVDFDWNGSEHAIVWRDARNKGNTSGGPGGTGQIFFATVSANGKQVGSETLLDTSLPGDSASLGLACDPKIAWNGTAYGVMWAHAANIEPDTCTGMNSFRFRTFTSLGAPILAQPVSISFFGSLPANDNSAGYDTPILSWSSDRTMWDFVFRYGRDVNLASNAADLRSTVGFGHVDAAGTVSRYRLSAGNDTVAVAPLMSAVFSPTAGHVAYMTYVYGTEVDPAYDTTYCRFSRSATGSLACGSSVSPTAASRDDFYPALAWVGAPVNQEVAILAAEENTPTTFATSIARVSAASEGLTSAYQTIEASRASYHSSPRLLWGGSQFVRFYGNAITPTGSDLQMDRITAAGSLVAGSEATLTSQSKGVSTIVVKKIGDRYAATWLDYRHGTGPFAVPQVYFSTFTCQAAQ